MSEWIKCGLPWCINYSKFIKFKSLGHDEFIKSQGFIETSHDFRINNKIDELFTKMCPKYGHGFTSKLKRGDLFDKSEDILLYKQYLDLIDKENIFLIKHPYVIELQSLNESLGLYIKQMEAKLSFSGAGLNKPGTLVKVKYGNNKIRTYLIGDILDDGCDQSQDVHFGAYHIIEEYKVTNAYD